MSIFTGLINDSFKQLHADAITELVTGCAIDCDLIFGQTLFTDCPNCLMGTDGKSSNIYQTGGSQPFQGICPVCFGKGRIASEQTTEISLAIIYDYKSWIKIGPPINTPNGFVQTLSILSTLEDIKRAKELIVDTSLESMVRQRFERYGEPQPCGLGQATIVVTMWKRIEN